MAAEKAAITEPFPHRAPSPWCDLNKVTGICGKDPLYESGVKDDGPIVLSEEIRNGGMDNVPAKVDLLIVGAGLSGAVIAERCSRELGMTSLIVENRDHIGGNCYDYVEEHGIRVSRYGAHLFHTKYDRVWDYVTQFSEWMPYDHRVRGLVPDKDGIKRLVPIPPVQDTVNTLFGENITSEEEMQAWYDKKRIPCPGDQPSNSEEAALARVGPELFDCIFKHYTKKQWDKYPAELDASVMLRLPCRTSTDERYFGDDWQALPLRGYTRIFENMLLNDPNISIRLGVDFFKARANGKLPEYGMLVYTGPIDAYFAQQGMPKLEYRSLRFEEEFVEKPNGGYFQEAMVVNYPSPDVPFTRIVEYKHVPNQAEAVKEGKVAGSLIAREYSSAEGDPYYPVPNPENTALYEKYRALAEQESNVAFVGRLASYKYFNMDQAILNALEMFDNLKTTGKLQPKRRPEDFGPGDGPK
jgi:UDP-galactopyranose mutase